MVNETRKIMGDDSIDVCPTCVRVPVLYSHSESILVETERPITPEAARELWSNAPGLTVLDDPVAAAVPPARLGPRTATTSSSAGSARTCTNPNALLFWCVGDNLRKGAAPERRADRRGAAQARPGRPRPPDDRQGDPAMPSTAGPDPKTTSPGSRTLRSAVAGMTGRPAPGPPVAGKWITLEVVCHLADFDAIYADRIKRIIATDRTRS